MDVPPVCVCKYGSFSVKGTKALSTPFFCLSWLFIYFSSSEDALTRLAQTFSKRESSVEFNADTRSELFSKFTLDSEGCWCKNVGFSSFRRQTLLFASSLSTRFHALK